MNTLRLEIINLHTPYKVLQDPETLKKCEFFSFIYLILRIKALGFIIVSQMSTM